MIPVVSLFVPDRQEKPLSGSFSLPIQFKFGLKLLTGTDTDGY
jgi:hypothetical protein